MAKILVPKKGLFDLLPRGLKSKLLFPLVTTVFGGGVVPAHTLLTAQKYEVNWEDLESAFPQCRNFEKFSEKWQYLESIMGPQGTLDPDMWDYINKFRQSAGQPRRMVRNKLVTTAFVDFVVDQLQTETSVFGDFKYHENGLGTTAEAITDTAMETSTGIARATGTQTETDHDTYKSIGTITADATEAWTEHGLFNASTAGTLMDRTVHGALNVVSGNQVEYTFEISFAAGG
jgi:hypothetical protein